ncbi:MAG: hypothetical protein GWP68_09685 [Verrucomicrobiaceae bacterium]|nr:hypothetical protein [Verrucomicrobiaceae bacterium]
MLKTCPTFQTSRNAPNSRMAALQLQLPTSTATQWQSLIRHQLRFLRS